MPHGSIAAIKLCLDRSRSLRYGNLPQYLMLRKRGERAEILELLLNLGFPIDSIWPQNKGQERERGTTLFHTAMAGRDDMTAYLLSRGADPTIVSSMGRTALEASVGRYHSNVTKLLREWNPPSQEAPSLDSQMEADLYTIHSAFVGQ
jgi:hypothetical protein